MSIIHAIWNWYAACAHTNTPTGPQFFSVLLPILSVPLFAIWRLRVHARGGTFIPRPWSLITDYYKYRIAKRPKTQVPWIYLMREKDERLLYAGFYTRVHPVTHEVFKAAVKNHDLAIPVDDSQWIPADQFDKAVTWGAMHAKVHPPMVGLPDGMAEPGEAWKYVKSRFTNYQQSPDPSGLSERPPSIGRVDSDTGRTPLGMLKWSCWDLAQKGILPKNMYMEADRFDYIFGHTGEATDGKWHFTCRVGSGAETATTCVRRSNR